jgi:hypothetical protein
MPNDVWFWLFVVSMVGGLAWSVSREFHIFKLYLESREIQKILRQIVKRINSSDRMTKEKFADLTDQIRAWVQEQKLDRVVDNVRDGHGTRIDINGGQNNVGDNDIRGDQRQS